MHSSMETRLSSDFDIGLFGTLKQKQAYTPVFHTEIQSLLFR